MRSRYVAFAQLNEPYLLATWHHRTRPDMVSFANELKWLGLTIIEARTDADVATVEFIARFRVGGGSAARLHERSNFVREEGRWLYVDGVQSA